MNPGGGRTGFPRRGCRRGRLAPGRLRPGPGRWRLNGLRLCAGHGPAGRWSLWCGGPGRARALVTSDGGLGGRGRSRLTTDRGGRWFRLSGRNSAGGGSGNGGWLGGGRGKRSAALLAERAPRLVYAPAVGARNRHTPVSSASLTLILLTYYRIKGRTPVNAGYPKKTRRMLPVSGKKVRALPENADSPVVRADRPELRAQREVR